MVLHRVEIAVINSIHIGTIIDLIVQKSFKLPLNYEILIFRRYCNTKKNNFSWRDLSTAQK